MQCAQLDPIWEALSVSIVKVVGEIATFRLSCADEPALCAAFAVPPSTKPTFGVLAGDAQNTLLPYRGEWNSDALSEWLAETARAVRWRERAGRWRTRLFPRERAAASQQVDETHGNAAVDVENERRALRVSFREATPERNCNHDAEIKRRRCHLDCRPVDRLFVAACIFYRLVWNEF